MSSWMKVSRGIRAGDGGPRMHVDAGTEGARASASGSGASEDAGVAVDRRKRMRTRKTSLIGDDGRSRAAGLMEMVVMTKSMLTFVLAMRRNCEYGPWNEACVYRGIRQRWTSNERREGTRRAAQ